MIKIALTGSIGMGKSTVAQMFAAQGIPVFDADAEVRAIQADDADLIAAIGKLFPDAVRAGRLDRTVLARLAPMSPERLAKLEALIHPRVRIRRDEFIAAHATARALLFEIPLLFETGGEGEFDKVIVVSALPGIQRARALARPGMTAAKLDAILARQMPDRDKRSRADFVIDTDTDLSTTERQVTDIIACLGLAQSR
ncbi:dephospho-CoA kinase [Sphingomonas piscis]|uniref:Dephospho-CoA kinase n=1 Tax=Sphingomonas piscis TaxID=2714943 RepID=A0A6G7YPN6_9SPHN|nr:dephospho-CoA kinase [Sphingomonas piscis]QIK78703.1 dephospho-CoA kinase [Sphingomonas piscis]